MLVHTTPETYVGRTFNEPVVLDFDAPLGAAKYYECIFDAGLWHVNGAYACSVAKGRKPHATFKGCRFRNAAKCFKGHSAGFFDCIFEEAEDGIFADDKLMALHVEHCRFQKLGGLPGEHSDAIQTTGGYLMTIKHCLFELDSQANSAIFLESLYYPVERVNIGGCRFKGAGYYVWSIEDPNHPAGPNRRIVIQNCTAVVPPVFGPVAYTPGSKPLELGNSWNV